MNKPLVTVITPAYNSSKYISETILSVQKQTYTNWEMIIVDDCSQDNTVDIIEGFRKEDNRIKLITLDKNGGAGVARNVAINAAQGKYIAFLDSDDQWLPEKLEKQVCFMLEKDIAFSFTSYKVIKEGEELGNIIYAPTQITYPELLKNTIIGCLTVMLDIEKLGKVQMPEIRSRQDTALWLSILKQGYIAYGMKEVLSIYRIVPGSISSNKLKVAKQNWKLYREIEKLNIFYATWCFLHYAWNGIKKNTKLNKEHK